MADILVRFNQAETDVQSWANLKARHLGFSEEALGFWFKFDDDTDFGDPVLVPSTIGQGMGRRVTQTAHGFATKTLIRHNGSAWVKAISTTDVTTLATHMVVRVLDANRFELSALGAWSLGGAPVGPYYLSETTAGALSSTEPVVGISQRVAVGDGTALHLTLSGGVTSPSVPTEGFREAVLSIVKAPPSSPVSGGRYLIYKTPTPGTFFEGHGKHIATYNGSTWSYEVPSVGWAVIVKSTGVPYFYTISGAWKPMYSGAGFTEFADPTAYVSGELIVWDGADAFDPETAGGRPPTGRSVPAGRVYGTAPATPAGLKGYCGVGGRAAYDDGWAIFGFAPGGESIESNHGIMTFFASDDGPGAQSQGFLFASGSGPSQWNDLLYMEDGWGYQFHQMPSTLLLGTNSAGKLVDATDDADGVRVALGAHPLEDQRLRTTDAVEHTEVTAKKVTLGTWGFLQHIPSPAPVGYGGGFWPGGRTPAINNYALLVSADGQVVSLAADDHVELQVGPPAARAAGLAIQWDGSNAQTALPETTVTKLHVNTDMTLGDGALHVGLDGDLVYTHPTGQHLFNGNFLYSWTHQGGGDYSNRTVDSTSETTVIDATTQGRNGIVPVIAAGYLLSQGPIWVRVRGGYGVIGANPVLTVRVYFGSTVVGVKRIDLSTFTRTTENMGMSLLFWIEPLDYLNPGTNLRLRAHHYGQASKGLADSAGSFLLSENETYSNIDATVAQNLRVTAQWSALGSQTWAFFDGIEVYR